MCTLGSSGRRLKYLGPSHPCERSGLSSRLLALGLVQAQMSGETEPDDASSCSFSLLLSTPPQKKKKKVFQSRHLSFTHLKQKHIHVLIIGHDVLFTCEAQREFPNTNSLLKFLQQALLGTQFRTLVQVAGTQSMSHCCSLPESAAVSMELGTKSHYPDVECMCPNWWINCNDEHSTPNRFFVNHLN